MAGMGPAPKAADQRARRNVTSAVIRLPAGGRTGRVPAWPLIPDVVMTTRRDQAAAKVERLEFELDEAGREQRAAVERRLDSARERLAILDAQLREQRKLEKLIWGELWKTPQSCQWERLGWTREVAQYVRHKVLGELGVLDDAREARQWSDRLGLTPMALLRLRWEIVPDEVGEKRSASRSARSKYRDLRVVAAGK